MSAFTVRVYGIFIQKGQILISDEVYNGTSFTKFPGGGLEWGEGTIAALKREIKEELEVSIENINHFYTTDFFVSSVFDKKKQVFSIYYTAEFSNHLSSRKLSKRPDKNLPIKGEWFRWVNLNELTDNDLSFPVDRIVLGLIKDRF